MRLAFVTGALATGFTAAGMTAIVIWIASVVTGSGAPWDVAPWLVPLVSAIVAAATYLAEAILHRRSMARMRSTGEPWAYRER
jgi:hypothetical protein